METQEIGLVIQEPVNFILWIYIQETAQLAFNQVFNCYFYGSEAPVFRENLEASAWPPSVVVYHACAAMAELRSWRLYILFVGLA